MRDRWLAVSAVSDPSMNGPDSEVKRSHSERCLWPREPESLGRRLPLIFFRLRPSHVTVLALLPGLGAPSRDLVVPSRSLLRAAAAPPGSARVAFIL